MNKKISLGLCILFSMMLTSCHQHKYITTTIQEDCEECGRIVERCECGDEIKIDDVEAKQHTLRNETKIQDGNAIITTSCSACGKTIGTQSYPVVDTGDSYVFEVKTSYIAENARYNDKKTERIITYSLDKSTYKTIILDCRDYLKIIYDNGYEEIDAIMDVKTNHWTSKTSVYVGGTGGYIYKSVDEYDGNIFSADEKIVSLFSECIFQDIVFREQKSIYKGDLLESTYDKEYDVEYEGEQIARVLDTYIENEAIFENGQIKKVSNTSNFDRKIQTETTYFITTTSVSSDTKITINDSYKYHYETTYSFNTEEIIFEYNAPSLCNYTSRTETYYAKDGQKACSKVTEHEMALFGETGDKASEYFDRNGASITIEEFEEILNLLSA